jgi:hypothetical protein
MQYANAVLLLQNANCKMKKIAEIQSILTHCGRVFLFVRYMILVLLKLEIDIFLTDWIFFLKNRTLISLFSHYAKEL